MIALFILSEPLAQVLGIPNAVHDEAAWAFLERLFETDQAITDGSCKIRSVQHRFEALVAIQHQSAIVQPDDPCHASIGVRVAHFQLQTAAPRQFGEAGLRFISSANTDGHERYRFLHTGYFKQLTHSPLTMVADQVDQSG